MSEALKEEYLKLLEEEYEYRRANQLNFWQPYPKQKELHDALEREVFLMAGNQLGKTLAGSRHVAYNITGKYPDWWEGLRIKGPNKWWVAGEKGKSTRDIVQKYLLGELGELGTGAIPKDLLGDFSRDRGTTGLIDNIKIKHFTDGVFDGWSTLFFKTYGEGMEGWMAETLTGGVWFDEIPPFDVYMEGLTRTNRYQRQVIVTFTPVKGFTPVVLRFTNPEEGATGRKLITMSIDDVPHYTKEQRQEIINQYPPHLRETRAHGQPYIGSGLIYPIQESNITCEAFEVPSQWPKICGMDFGWTHPTTAVWLTHDTDSDTVYLYDCYSQKEQTPVVHSSAVKARGRIPVAWPHDMTKTGLDGGASLKGLYLKEGLPLLHEKAHYDDSRGNKVEQGVMDILQRMQTGRFKVFSHLQDWFEEFRSYHRNDGKIVKERDDLMDATRYAVMMLRHAKVVQTGKKMAKLKYPSLGLA